MADSHLTVHSISGFHTLTMYCRHCGISKDVRIPLPLVDAMAALSDFWGAHADCTRRDEPSGPF